MSKTYPGKKIPIYLDCDSDVPESCRPVFYIRSQTWREQIEYAEAFDWLYSDSTNHKGFRELSEAMCRVLNMAYCGWDNACNHSTGEVVDYSPELWVDVLTGVEQAQELIRKVLTAGRLSADEKKS